MILIISSEADNTTNKVIKWLKYNGVEFVRINETTKVVVKGISISNEQQEIELILNDSYHQNRIICTSEINSVWYRRGKINIFLGDKMKEVLLNSEHIGFYRHLEREIEFVEYYIYELLKEKRYINTYLDDKKINKIEALKVAKECGLAIPNTFLSGFGEDVKSYYGDEQEVITKAIRYGSFVWDNNEISAGTHLVKKDDISSTRYFPSLFQEKLDKEYEIRSFYLHGKFYSIAIFSQLDEQTEIDFRNYNYSKPNRTPPYILPEEITAKLHVLMNRLELNCGSIDLVYTKQKEFVFLEVNPIGQFEQVSVPGNYFLEYEVAEFLADRPLNF